jgi:hypothetical protein
MSKEETELEIQANKTENQVAAGQELAWEEIKLQTKMERCKCYRRIQVYRQWTQI